MAGGKRAKARQKASLKNEANTVSKSAISVENVKCDSTTSQPITNDMCVSPVPKYYSFVYTMQFYKFINKYTRILFSGSQCILCACLFSFLLLALFAFPLIRSIIDVLRVFGP